MLRAIHFAYNFCNISSIAFDCSHFELNFNTFVNRLRYYCKGFDPKEIGLNSKNLKANYK